MKQELNRSQNSLFPSQEFESEDDESWQVSYLDIITIVLGFLIILLSASQITKQEFTSLSSIFGKLSEESEFITTPINNIQEELYTLLEPDINAGNIEIIRDLNDIRIRFRSDDLYQSGSAKLETPAIDLINRVLIALMQVHYNDFQIDIEGHTDSTPISSDTYPSNWELSTARASNIVRYFNEAGVSSKRLKASGYADSRPVIEYDSLGLPFAAPKDVNRRVVLRLYYDAENLRRDMSQPADSTRAEQNLPEEELLANDHAVEELSVPVKDTDVDMVISNEPVMLEVTSQQKIDEQLAQNSPTSVPENTEDEQLSTDRQTPETSQSSSQDTTPTEIQPKPVVETPKEQPKPVEPKREEPAKLPAPTNTMPNLLRVDQRCVFSVELASFDELSRGFQRANTLEEQSGESLEILYNNHQYSLRNKTTQSFANALDEQARIATQINDADIGVVHQCYNNTYQRPRPIKYQIQFGAFQNRDNGLSYAMNLLDKYDIQTYMDRSGDNYNVMMGPYDTREEVLSKMQELREKGVESSIFIKHQIESASEYKYAYQIQIVTSRSIGEAQQSASQIAEATGVNTRVVELIPGQYSVMSGQSTSWNETQTIFNRLRTSRYETDPVIFILEYR